MKLFLLLCTVFLKNGIDAYVYKQEAEVNQILNKIPKINEYFTECIIERNEDALQNETLLLEEEDRIGVELINCFFNKVGILGDDGKLSVGAARAILNLIGVDDDEADQLIGECTSIAGVDGTDMAYAIFQCFEDGVRK